MKMPKKLSILFFIGILFSCRQVADARDGAENWHNPTVSGVDFSPIEEMFLYFEGDRPRSPFNRSVMHNLFPEFFVSNTGFDRTVRGSDEAVENHRLSAAAFMQILANRVVAKPRSISLIILVSRRKATFDTAASSFEKHSIYESSLCSASALSLRGDVFSLAIWAKSQPRISVIQPEIYKCLTKAFAYAYGINTQTAQDYFFGKNRRPLRETDCSLYSEATQPNNLRSEGGGCLTPAPRFEAMLLLISRNLRVLGCDGSALALCQAPVSSVLLGDEKPITQLGHDLEARWAESMAWRRKFP